MSTRAFRPSGRSPYGGPRRASPQPDPEPDIPLWRRLREDEWPSLSELPTWAWVVLLFPCLWLLTLPLMATYLTARLARRVARRVFPVRPEGQAGNPEVLRVQQVRAWVALAMSGVLMAVFGGWQDVWDAPGQIMQRVMLAPWVALLSAAVMVALLFWAARPTARQAMRAQLRPAGRSALWYVGAWILVPLLFMAADKAMALLPDEFIGSSGLLLLVLVAIALLVIWAPFWWVIFFLCFASGPALRHAFNLRALHAALPALVTSVLVWALAFSSLSVGGLPPGPVPLAVCAFLAGPVSVTAIAWWEIHRLRRRHGMRWRG